MGVINSTKCLHVILATTVFLFKLMEYSSAQNVIYREIDHSLQPRKIENINDMTPLPVPEGKDFKMRKYPVSKKNIQQIIRENDEKNESNKINRKWLTGETPSWKNESQIRSKSKLKSVLGTTGEVYYDADWGLMSAVLTCYNNHWALKTGPEDWWTIVIRRLVQAMDEYGEVPQVRNFFVEHQGKKKLEVIVGPSLSNIDYNWLFSQFADRIKVNLKEPTYVDIITNNFNSSTAEQTMISQIMLMSSVKSYFEFGFGTACGIPGVEMKGTQEDWMKLIDKLNRLQSLLSPISKYLRLEAWFKNARDVFMNLSDTYKGNPNIKWWGNILTWVERWGSGEHSYWDGWFPKFVGALNEPGEYIHFASDMVSVPVHISDQNSAPPVADDGILVGGIIGFNVQENGRAPVVEPQHAWSLLLPEDSPVADRLTGKYTGADTSNPLGTFGVP